jgi:hypothetical protein
MKCALHIHTNLSDGLHSPEEILLAYQSKGFQCVAITDHQFMTKPNYFNIIERVSQQFSEKMLILPGIEIDYEPWNYQHLLEIKGNKETLRILCHPRAYYLTPEQILKQIQSVPFHLDAMEITHRGFYTPEYDISQIPLPKVATDDAHEIYDIGRGWVETENFTDPDLLIRAIRAGEFSSKFA